jgi:hypothetical protein
LNPAAGIALKRAISRSFGQSPDRDPTQRERHTKEHKP